MNQQDFMETPEQFIERAVELAHQAHKGKTQKYGDGIPSVNHPMTVAFLVSRLTDEPKAIATAWLHDVIETTQHDPVPVTYEDLAKGFGYIVTGMVRTLASPGLDPTVLSPAQRETRVRNIANAGDMVQMVALADLMELLIPITMNDWVYARDYITQLEYALTQWRDVAGILQGAAVSQIKKSKFYLDEVIGDAPLTTHKLSTGHPSTLGSYKMLCTTNFGEDSPAVSFLKEKIAESTHGVGEVVPTDEGQMLVMLYSLHETKMPEGTTIQ